MSGSNICSIIQSSSTLIHHSQSHSHSRWQSLIPFPFHASNLRTRGETRNPNVIPVKSLQVQGGVEGILSPLPEIGEPEEEVVSDFETLDKEEKGDWEEVRAEQKEEEDSRFKLRNGKEVLAEKAYLVGVEQKGVRVDSFGIEESLDELAQLADTAGLQVVGSTYQKKPQTFQATKALLFSSHSRFQTTDYRL